MPYMVLDDNFMSGIIERIEGLFVMGTTMIESLLAIIVKCELEAGCPQNRGQQ